MNTKNTHSGTAPAESYTSEHIFLHAWNIITGTNNRILQLIFKQFGSFEYAWKHITPDQLIALSPELQLNTRKPTCDPMKEWRAFIQTATQNHITFTLHTSPDYPPLLKHLPKAPFGLYTQGKIDELHMKNHIFLSVVGTRRATPYGIIQTQKIIQSIATACAERNIIIVSGLADGIDTIAHESALLEGLPTWAIIGHGWHYLRRSQHDLAQQILEAGGAIISEYPPNTPPEKYRYPERNRIIAGISPATLVTEAPASSGANITAKIAFEEDRDLYALVADIDRTDCAGNLDLIERNMAIPVTSYRKFRELLGIISSPPGQLSLLSARTLSFPHDLYLQKIIDTLTYKHATPASQLFESTGIPTISLLLQKLTDLEIDGLIEQIAGGYRLRK